MPAQEFAAHLPQSAAQLEQFSVVLSQTPSPQPLEPHELSPHERPGRLEHYSYFMYFSDALMYPFYVPSESFDLVYLSYVPFERFDLAYFFYVFVYFSYVPSERVDLDVHSFHFVYFLYFPFERRG